MSNDHHCSLLAEQSNMRYFMIDRITEFCSGKTAAAIKNVTFTDEILHDHFPDYPVYPGAFVVESMAQLGGFLLEMSFNTPDCIRRALLAQIDRAKFYKNAEPGDQLLIEATISAKMDDAAKVSFRANISGEKMAVAKLTYVMKTIDSEKIHQQRRDLYKLWTKHLDQALQIL